MSKEPKGSLVNIFLRFSPFLDVIGAILIFGSWIAANTLSNKANSQAGTHRVITERIRQYRIYDDFSRRIVDIQSEIEGTHTLTEQIARNLESQEGKTQQYVEIPPWTGMTFTQIQELSDFAESLILYSQNLPILDTTRMKLKEKKTQIKELISSFNTAFQQYEQLKETTAGLTSKDEAVTEQWDQLQKTVHGLWEQYNQIKREMYKVGTAIEESAEKESAAAGKLASKFRNWSYLLYILGTLMILTGRLRVVLKATRPVAG